MSWVLTFTGSKCAAHILNGESARLDSFGWVPHPFKMRVAHFDDQRCDWKFQDKDYFKIIFHFYVMIASHILNEKIAKLDSFDWVPHPFKIRGAHFDVKRSNPKIFNQETCDTINRVYLCLLRPCCIFQSLDGMSAAKFLTPPKCAKRILKTQSNPKLFLPLKMRAAHFAPFKMRAAHFEKGGSPWMTS